LKPHRATPAEATTQSGSLSVPARGAHTLPIFWICAILNSPLRLSTASSPSNVVATANQESRQSRRRPHEASGRTDTNITDDMRSGRDQRPRGRFNANRPFNQQPRTPQNNQTFDSNGPNIKIRGSAHQIFERYLALAREATASDDRIAAENFYQHAEHYFRIDNARRESNQQGTPPRPTTPADVEMNSTEVDAREVDRFEPRWDGDDSISSETSTH
jgi:Domain of unknown function (DUF4167)